MQKKFGPVCPNHGEPLEGIGFPMPKKGTGICPVSGCPFDYVIELDDDVTKMVKDKEGNLTKATKIKVTGEEPTS